MRRFGIGLGIFFLCIILIIVLNTSLVKRASYFNEEYYRNTSALIDSIGPGILIVNDSVQAGFAKVSITPGTGNTEDIPSESKFMQVPLAGYGDREGRPATGIHDSLFVKAVALKAGNRTVVIAGADILIMPPNIIDTLTLLLAEKGIRRDQLFFSATHTHSGPGAWGPGFVGEQFAGKENSSIEKWLVSQIGKAVIAAIDDLSPARIGSGIFSAAPYTRNRLSGDLGTKNNDFAFIVAEQTGGKKAIIGSFSAHPTTLGDDNMEFSADYPGYWERKVEETSADMALFCAGSMGSQSPSGQGTGFEKAKFIGEALADSLVKNLDQVALNERITFSAMTLKIVLPDYHFRLTTKINLSSFLSRILMPPPGDVYLQVLRLDNMLWITTPGDFSGEYALLIKNSLAAQGFKANVTSFNGDYIGYIIPGKYYYIDEYESKLMGWFGPNMGDYTMEIIHRMTDIVSKQVNN